MKRGIDMGQSNKKEKSCIFSIVKCIFAIVTKMRIWYCKMRICYCKMRIQKTWAIESEQMS